MENLKPCPFCGGEAEQDDWRNNEHMFFGTRWIGCRKCRFFINYTGKDRGKEEAIAAWTGGLSNMKQSIRDRVKLWWFNVRERFLWSIVKRCVQRIDKMNCGAFMAFSWGVDEVTDYHVIAERSLENCHVYGTRVEYYGKQEGEQ